MAKVNRSRAVGLRLPADLTDAICKYRCELEEKRREELPGCNVTFTDTITGLCILGLRAKGIEVEGNRKVDDDE